MGHLTALSRWQPPVKHGVGHLKVVRATMSDNATRYDFSRQEYACDLTVEAPVGYGRNVK